MREIPVIPWQPRYTLTPAMARRLMEIEAARAAVEQIPLPPAVVSEMRNRARLRSTHYSTRIEGNRLTLAEAEQVLAGRKVPLHGRERDVEEDQPVLVTREGKISGLYLPLENPDQIPGDLRGDLISAVGRHIAGALEAKGVREEEILENFDDFRRRRR